MGTFVAVNDDGTIIVSTNTNAVTLWKKLGFEIIGTTPKGFRHKKLGLVDTYFMYKQL